jgi:hypothetical protein
MAQGVERLGRVQFNDAHREEETTDYTDFTDFRTNP